jgi:acyl carrier protein
MKARAVWPQLKFPLCAGSRVYATAQPELFSHLVITTHKTMPESTVRAPSTSADAALLREVAELVVSALNLEVSADDVQPDEPLYGDGLGLDSIDILEIALVVSKHYGLQLRADHEDNHAIFHSLRSLGDHIAAWRTQ